MHPSLTSSRVAIVSGKGGVGKTTIAAALAKAAAAQGKRVLLLEVEGRNSLAPLFGIPSLGYPEHVVAPNLSAESVVPDEALVEYLYMFYGIKRIGKALAHTKATEFATNIAPGLRDILLIGKVKEAERRRVREAYAFDLVVLDAPPTGRLPRFLDAPRAVADLVRAGPIRTQAHGVLDMITDPARSAVVLVTLPEEMPVQETVESIATLRRMGVAVGPVVVNRVAAEPFTKTVERSLISDARKAIARAMEKAGVAAPAATLERLAAVAAASARRTRNQRAVMTELEADIDRPMISVPALLSPTVGPAEVDFLASVLSDSGAIS
ncbi:MAG: ArsA family ATPase [Actinomycetota bacterium]|nr:AAA family ATPase [Actinomycetota bacterium]